MRLLALLIGFLVCSSTANAQTGGTTPSGANSRQPQCTSPESVNFAKQAQAKGERYACYDDGQTQSGNTHVCPAYFVMTGAAHGNNWFHCTYVGNISGEYWATGATAAEQISMNGYASIRCKEGTVMLGMNVGENRLRCGKIDSASAPEQVRLVAGAGVVTACPAVGDPQHLGVMIGWNQMRTTMFCQSVKFAATTAKRGSVAKTR